MALYIYPARWWDDYEFCLGKAMAGSMSWHIVKTIRLERLTKTTKELGIASTLDKTRNEEIQDTNNRTTRTSANLGVFFQISLCGSMNP
jgi:hypothetical protein